MTDIKYFILVNIFHNNIIDAINSSIELGSILFMCLSVRRILIDKQVKGVSIFQLHGDGLWCVVCLLLRCSKPANILQTK
jgi:hypothetical protein